MAAKVLITGGAGFIGTYLTRALKDRAEVVLIDNLLPQVHAGRQEFPEELQEMATCITGDVRDREVWNRIALEHPDIDTIVHLAALTGTGQSMYDIREYDSVNCGGTATMLEAILDKREPSKCLSKVRRVILASSRAIYGEGAYRSTKDMDGLLYYPQQRTAEQLAASKWGFPAPDGSGDMEPVQTTEDAPPQPTSFYGVTKLVQEQYVRTMLTAAGIEHTILRFQNVFGAGQSLKNPYTGVIGVFYSNIVGGRPLSIYEDGEITRDFVYVTDVVSAVVKSIFAEKCGTYNIGSGEFSKLTDVAKWLCEALGREVPMNYDGAYRVGDIRHNAADLSRAHAELNYSPEVSVKEGLRRYVEWASQETPMNAETIATAANALKAAGLSGRV